MVIWHLKQIGKVKKLDKWVPHELTTNKKMPFWSVVFSYSTHTKKTNHFFVGLWCVTKSGFYTTTGNDQLSGWTDKLQSTSQSQNCTKKKVIVTVWWSAAHLIHYNFLKPSKTITFEKYVQQINGMHQKLQHLQPALVNRKGPTFLHNSAWQVTPPTLQNLNELGYEVLPHLPCLPDLSPTDYHFFKHIDSFLQGKCFHNQQEAENAFQEFVKSWSADFYAIGINKLTSHWQWCIDYNGSYFD